MLTPQFLLPLADEIVAPDPDRRAVFLRVMRTWANGALRVGELFSCWRPPGPGARPWRDEKIFRVIDELIAEGSLTKRAGCTGDVLYVTDDGVRRYSAAAPRIAA